MTIKEIIGLVDGKVICCEERLNTSVEYAFASDLMSDVLTIQKENMLLITGLANMQAIRTSEMSDINCIVFARDKKIGEDMVSVASSVKKILRQLNIDHATSKRIVIALYEGEVNVVAHAYAGIAQVDIDKSKVIITITDNGPGIADIDLAMEEGYSTATPQVREMGFGAGMGLSNMKKNSDSMHIKSVPGEGIVVELINYIGTNG